MPIFRGCHLSESSTFFYDTKFNLTMSTSNVFLIKDRFYRC